MSPRGLLMTGVLLGTLAVAGCALGPDYERPQTITPEAFEQAEDSGTSIANLNWWELFNDEQLTSLINYWSERVS